MCSATCKFNGPVSLLLPKQYSRKLVAQQINHQCHQIFYSKFKRINCFANRNSMYFCFKIWIFPHIFIQRSSFKGDTYCLNLTTPIHRQHLYLPVLWIKVKPKQYRPFLKLCIYIVNDDRARVSLWESLHHCVHDIYIYIMHILPDMHHQDTCHRSVTHLFYFALMVTIQIYYILSRIYLKKRKK